MIKDILVTLPAGDTPPFAVDYAITVARTFNAHLTGIAFVQDVASAGALDEFGRGPGVCRRLRRTRSNDG